MVTTVSPRPVQCRSGEPDDRELFGRVYRQARCATSCLEPDEWFPLTADVGRAREQAARAIAICAGCPVRADCLELSLRHSFGPHPRLDQLRRRQPHLLAPGPLPRRQPAAIGIPHDTGVP